MSEDVRQAAVRLADHYSRHIHCRDGIEDVAINCDDVESVARFALEAADRQAALRHQLEGVEVQGIDLVAAVPSPRADPRVWHCRMCGQRGEWPRGIAHTDLCAIGTLSAILVALDPVPAVAPGASDAGEGE